MPMLTDQSHLPALPAVNVSLSLYSTMISHPQCMRIAAASKAARGIPPESSHRENSVVSSIGMVYEAVTIPFDGRMSGEITDQRISRTGRIATAGALGALKRNCDFGLKLASDDPSDRDLPLPTAVSSRHHSRMSFWALRLHSILFPTHRDWCSCGRKPRSQTDWRNGRRNRHTT
jgi:hypothetical protein